MYNGYHVFEGIADRYGFNYHIIKAKGKKRAFEIMTECMKKIRPSIFYYVRFFSLENEPIKAVIDKCKNNQEGHYKDVTGPSYIYIEDKN